MKKLSALLAVLVLSNSILIAQQPNPALPGQRFAWDQAALTLADAQALTYKYYPDKATTGIVFTNVTCTGTASPFVCSVLIPAFTPGAHTLQLTATNAAGESAKSLPFDFNFVVTPGTPTNIRIVGSGGA